jgi:hypothetical protein
MVNGEVIEMEGDELDAAKEVFENSVETQGRSNLNKLDQRCTLSQRK